MSHWRTSDSGRFSSRKGGVTLNVMRHAINECFEVITFELRAPSKSVCRKYEIWIWNKLVTNESERHAMISKPISKVALAPLVFVDMVPETVIRDDDCPRVSFCVLDGVRIVVVLRRCRDKSFLLDKALQELTKIQQSNQANFHYVMT